MIKRYFMFSDILNFYANISLDDMSKEFGWLYLLFLSFRTFNPVTIVDQEENNKDITTIKLYFSGDRDNDYKEDEILRMSNMNYDYIVDQWNKVVDQRPKYFILSWNDNGWIDLELKNELSIEDQQYLDQEKIKKLSK